MNKCRHLLLLALLGLITACSLNELPENLSLLPIEEDGLVLQVETRAETYKGQSLDQEHFVTAEDLENFVKYRRSASKRSDLTVREVKSYGFDTSQTLFYILNYDQGWEVVSADKRIQPTLAHGDSGEFTMDCDNEAMKFWMNMLADGILQTRLGNVEKKSEEATASAESKDASAESTSDHTAFWDAISPTNTSRTRWDILVPIPGPADPEYYTYLVDTESEEHIQRKTKLTNTIWGQGSPWNAYCPQVTLGANSRAPAGCTAVAWAQILYYLATELGMDITMPTSATCTGCLLFNWRRFFYSFIPITPGSLANTTFDDNVDLTAMFIAYAGELSDMDYGADESTAFPDVLAEQILMQYNISCTQDYTYDENTIINRIMHDEPILIWGSESDSGGHAWVIDGYEKIYNTTTNYYVSYTEPKTQMYIDSLDKEDAHSSNTTTIVVSEQFYMNWGWDVGYNGWYATATDNWRTYCNVIETIYNFNQL